MKKWPDWLKWVSILLTAAICWFVGYIFPVPGVAKENAKSIRHIELVQQELKAADKELNAKSDANKDSIAKIAPELSELKTHILWIRENLEKRQQ